MDREQLIAAYFSNTLSSSDKVHFDELIKTDPEFKAEVTFQKRVQQTIHQQETPKLKSHLNEIEKELENKGGSGTIKLWLIAASIAILLAISFFFSRSTSNQDVFASYYSTPANIVHPIVRNDDEGTLKTKAFIAYTNKNYSEAHVLFSNLYEQHQNSEILFYDAISLLEIDSTTTAIAKLKLHENFNDAVSDKTQWYLALAYLKNNDSENSQTIFKAIVHRKTYNYKKAKKILKELD